MTTQNIPVFTAEQRAKWEERRREQERLAHIFNDQRPPGSGLNLEAITILIGWAEQDVNTLAQFRLRGSWDQGTWGTVVADEDLAEALLDGETDDPSRSQTKEVTDKALLNGACETAYCMAGQAVTQAGYEMVFNSSTWSGGLQASAEYCEKVEFTGRFDDKGWPIMNTVEGTVATISSKAARILGLNPTQSDLFFSGSNEIDDLKQYANGFAADAGMDLPYPDSDVWEVEEDPYATFDDDVEDAEF